MLVKFLDITLFLVSGICCIRYNQKIISFLKKIYCNSDNYYSKFCWVAAKCNWSAVCLLGKHFMFC